jgi:hypothetical protein
MIVHRLVVATILSIASSAALGQTTCVTAYGSCAATGPAGSQCYCATPNGPAAGTVAGAGGSGAFPLFCCTPAGRFGPNPNSKVPVGAPCEARLPNGSNMMGQACY